MYSAERCQAILKSWGFVRVAGSSSETSQHVLYQDREGNIISVRKFHDLTEEQRTAVLKETAEAIGKEFFPRYD